MLKDTEENATRYRIYLLSVGSIKHTVDMMLKYTEKVYRKVFQKTNNRNLFLVEVITLSQNRSGCGETHRVSLKRHTCKDSTVEFLKVDTI